MQVMRSAGGFRFLAADGPFSDGVAAEPGYRIVRVRLPHATPLANGFRLVESTLAGLGRPMAALCAMELRIPKPLTPDEFNAFNRPYVAQHDRWGLRVEGHVPTARTNVAPEIDPPSEPALHAFCHTIEGQGPRATFVISGAPEAPGTEGGLAGYWASMAGTMHERMSALGVTWDDATESQFYGSRADHQLFAAQDLPRFAEVARPGLRWFFSRPPVDTLNLEVDVRGLAEERMV